MKNHPVQHSNIFHINPVDLTSQQIDISLKTSHKLDGMRITLNPNSLNKHNTF